MPTVTIQSHSRLYAGILQAALFSFLLFVILSVAASKNQHLLPDGLYTYDEADYRHAVNQGFLANYLDRGALSLRVFIAKGFKAGFNKEEWGRLSQFVRSSSEIAFYRHYHGPLYFYWLIAMKHLGATTEKQMRYATLLLLFFCTLVLCALLVAFFPGQPRTMPFSLAALFMFGPSIILTFNHLTPHGLYLLFSCTSLGSAALYGKTSDRRYWYGSLAAASFSFLTLEYTAFLILTLAATLWYFRKTHLTPLNRKEKRRFLVFSLLCFVLPVIILWPGGILKLTIVKNYLYYAYFMLIRGEYYGHFSVFEIWAIRLAESPLEYAALLSGIAATVIMIKKNRWLIPLALYGACVLFTGIRNTSPLPQYLASVFPAFYLIAAVGLFALLDRKTAIVKTAFSLAIAAAVAVNCCSFFTFFAPRSWQRMPHQITTLDLLNDLVPENRIPVFIGRDYIPTFHYYFPGGRFHPFNPVFENDTAVVERIAGFMRENNTAVLLFLDRELPATRELISAMTTMVQRWELFLSDRAPNAVCYRLSPKQ
ncbi:MAG: hypothetical protein JXA71_19685 [Chitinispirillaceae bacterium]|nr:hypothetical protein [Chitinispirillaceae bacterium]